MNKSNIYKKKKKATVYVKPLITIFVTEEAVNE